MSTPEQQVQNYYQNLLILQYAGQPKASAHIGALVAPVLQADSNIQLVAFSGTPASGTFKLSYNGLTTSAIAYNASDSTIQADLNAILTAPLTVVVTGSISAGLTVTFSGTTTAIQSLSVTSSLADSLSNAVLGTVTAIGQQLPLEIQSGFSLSGSPAVGVQLDSVGKYVGVSRSGNGFLGPITLNDTDFLTLIQMGIVKNSSKSSLAAIQNLLHQFFAGSIYVFDYTNMNMSYLISTTIGSQNLIDLFVTEGLLPKPMGVGLSVIAAPVITEFYGFITYDATTNPLGTPFNTYDTYSNVWTWVSYDNAVNF